MGLFDSLKNMFGGGAAASGSKPVDVVKRFDLRGRTGQGSMSKVYQAFDNKLGRGVCLKLLDKEKTKQFEERFKLQGIRKPSEGEISMALRHPNLIVTYDHGISMNGEPFLVMEWVEGLGLNFLVDTQHEQLKGNRVNFMVQLADAIAYMHSQKYLHRDLCPRNIMITKDDVVKLIDFGLTVPYTPDFCKPGNRTGTADYLAPEIIKRMATDHRVDIFALGVTAFEVFTGQLPWEKGASSEETFKRHLNTPPRNPKELNPKLEDDVCRLLMKAIAKDPKERLATATAFKEALERLRRQDY